ncbi:MAG: large conductance mechanosensitive channel protein MscL [Acidobacteria bacterium]|nr:large conductance mechanosensitive channel protein MscL [Acidobacteriota bacterium]
MLKEFREFIARGSVIDLAVAVVIGAAFGRIITAFVDGIVMPPVGMLTGGVDFADLFYVLGSPNVRPASLEQAKAAGIPVIAYGQFINEVVIFLIVAFVVFIVLKHYNRLKSKESDVAGPTTKDCPLCLSTIPLAARRCSQCTADLGS